MQRGAAHRREPEDPARSRGSSVRLAGRDVLDRVSFEIAPGEFTGLIGSNGAGKTTLFRVILGLQAASAGSVLLAGPPAREHGRRHRLIGYVPQKFLLDPDVPLRARDLVGARHRRAPPRDPAALARAGAALVEEMLHAVDAPASPTRVSASSPAASSSAS